MWRCWRVLFILSDSAIAFTASGPILLTCKEKKKKRERVQLQSEIQSDGVVHPMLRKVREVLNLRDAPMAFPPSIPTLFINKLSRWRCLLSTIARAIALPPSSSMLLPIRKWCGQCETQKKKNLRSYLRNPSSWHFQRILSFRQHAWRSCSCLNKTEPIVSEKKEEKCWFFKLW
jgi:hypothetical protein